MKQLFNIINCLPTDTTFRLLMKSVLMNLLILIILWVEVTLPLHLTTSTPTTTSTFTSTSTYIYLYLYLILPLPLFFLCLYLHFYTNLYLYFNLYTSTSTSISGFIYNDKTINLLHIINYEKQWFLFLVYMKYQSYVQEYCDHQTFDFVNKLGNHVT